MEQSVRGILGVSTSIQSLRAYIPKVAASEAPVLITGETGTGKENIAANIHSLSRRRRGPFIIVNCAALPTSLFESEFFGHERGAFTGAVAAQQGWAAAANNGTLFLDEIGEMDLLSQAKLLRFLENGQVDRLGASRNSTSDVRIVAATNQPLEDLIEECRFRVDLYYRLNVAQIELQPLRKHPEDIPVLLEHFISELNDRTGLHVGKPASDLLEHLLDYDWPGNVRELRNLVEAVFIDPPRGNLHVNHLPPWIRKRIGKYHRTVPDERETLVAALKLTNWNKSEAARMLNISRMSVYRKIARYHLEDHEIQSP